MYHYTECGLDYIYLKNGFEIHETAYGEGVSIDNADELDKAIAERIIFDSPELSSAEVRFLRVFLDMSQEALARILDVSESTVRNWESSERTNIPGPAGLLLRNLAREMITGESGVRELVERIAGLNREIHGLRMELETSDKGWNIAA